MKILVRAPNWIGDAVMSLPAVRALPGDVTILVKPWVADVYAGRRIILLEGRSGLRDLAAKWRLAQQLRAEAFDLAVLFPNSFESAALVKAAGIRRVIAYNRDGRGLIIPDAIDPPAPGDIPEHERYYYLELLRRAGIIDSLPEVDRILLDDIASRRAEGERLLRAAELEGSVIGVSPGAAFGTAKRWIPERFAEAASQLGGPIAVFGSPSEKELCGRVAALSGGTSFAGKTTLAEFISMIAACRVFLCNDSGAMHLAAALDVPTVTVFGPTNEHATGPVSPKARILRVPVECAPCGKRECPLGHHRCMTNVSVADVVTAARG